MGRFRDSGGFCGFSGGVYEMKWEKYVWDTFREFTLVGFVRCVSVGISGMEGIGTTEPSSLL